jgi:hypothetical protein
VVALGKCAKHSGLQGRQVIANGLPNYRQFDSLVLVPEPVANAPHIPPGRTGDPFLGYRSETDCGFTDDLKLALDRRYGFWIFAECFEVHAERELLDHVNRIHNVAKR